MDHSERIPMAGDGRYQRSHVHESRWAALKQAKEASAPKKRRLSAEGRRNIIKGTNKRWAAFSTKKTAKEAKAA